MPSQHCFIGMNVLSRLGSSTSTLSVSSHTHHPRKDCLLSQNKKKGGEKKLYKEVEEVEK